MVACALETGDMYVFAFLVSLFVNGVFSAVRADDLVACCEEFFRPSGDFRFYVDRDGNNGVSFAEEIDFLLVLIRQAVSLCVEGHDVVRADIASGELCDRYFFIGMELYAFREVCVNGIPAAGVPRRDESADDRGFGIIRAAADAVMRIHGHNDGTVPFRFDCILFFIYLVRISRWEHLWVLPAK